MGIIKYNRKNHIDKGYINYLTEKISKGDIESGEKLYQIMKYPLYNHVKKFINSNQDIEDILHDIFLIYLKKTNKKISFINCFGLLFKIADRQIYKFFKKRKLLFLEELNDEQIVSDIQTDYDFSLIYLNLTERQKKIIKLRALGHTQKDIAKKTNISVSTIRRELILIRKICNNIK